MHVLVLRLECVIFQVLNENKSPYCILLFFRENPDIVKKNIKQFLDNNRILLKEIAFEIGIEEESIRLYIDGKEAFTKEQREEFYRWYLLKIFRPPSGLGKRIYYSS